VFKHILIATDGSELANKGVSRGLELAKQLGADVTILTVVQPLSSEAMRVALSGGVEDPVGRYDKQIDDGLRERYAAIEKEAAQYGLAVDMQHEFDDVPAVAIVREAESKNCDLIVMASHGRRGISKLLLGSQTAEVLVHTKIPVLVIR
jgi:nucleotide-binding universal stress UspA family protein